MLETQRQRQSGADPVNNMQQKTFDNSAMARPVPIHTHPLAGFLIASLLIVDMGWWGVQFAIQGWNINGSSTTFMGLQLLTTPNFIFRMLSSAAVIVGLVHANRELTVAAAFSSFTNLTINLAAWFLYSFPYAYLKKEMANTNYSHFGLILASRNGLSIGGGGTEYDRLLITSHSFSCIHIGVIFFMWLYSAYQISRNHRLSFRIRLSIHDIFNISLVSICLGGYILWSICQAYLGTFADFNYVDNLLQISSPALTVALFFALTVSAYVALGAGRRLTETALILNFISMMSFWSIFAYECRLTWQASVDGPYNLHACDAASPHCDPYMGIVAGIGIITGAQTCLTLVLMWASCVVPNDVPMSAEGGMYVGTGSVITKPNTYSGPEMAGMAVPPMVAAEMDQNVAYPTNSYPEVNIAPTTQSTPTHEPRSLYSAGRTSSGEGVGPVRATEVPITTA